MIFLKGVLIYTLLLHTIYVYSQDAEQCLAANVTQDGSAKYTGEVDLQLDATDLENYIDMCNDIGQEEPDISNLTRWTSERCIEYPIDNGDRECSEEPSVRWGYDAERRRCVQFEFTGCGGNENNFERQDECEALCVDLCTLRPQEGQDYEIFINKKGERERVSCREKAGVYYAYDPSTRACTRLNYRGCGGNRNIFESEQECRSTCNARIINVDTEPDVISVQGRTNVGSISLTSMDSVRGKRSADSTGTVNDLDRPAFCSKFEENYPDAAAIVKALDKTTSPDIDAELIEELESQIAAEGQTSTDGQTETTQQRQRRALLGLLTRPLKHTSVTILNNNNCRSVRITIRIKCVRAIFNRPTIAQKNKLCELVKAGIKKHWEVNILNNAGGLDYPVTVTVKESWFLSKKVMLKWYSSSPSNTNFLRSFNLGWWWIPMWMKYKGFNAGANEDLAFMETAAHEFGHDILMASGGLIWSWGHEGTSTIFGNTVSGTPQSPPNPQPINLMWYHVGGDFSNYYNRIRASQDQIKALVNYATFRFRPWWCPGAIGSPCILNSQCNPPGICSWFRCVRCNQDSQCPANQYCRGRYNPFIVNTCTARKSNGQLCSRDAMCISGMCDGGQCVECEEDHHCGSNQYCDNKDLPYILNRCRNKKPNGALCLQDRVCQSGMCDGGQCVECENDGHCPSGQWCKNKDFPLILNDCVNKYGNGGWCVRDAQCASGKCDGLRCVECEHDYECPANQWCKHKNLPLILNDCVNKKCTGWCSHGNQCLSGVCRWYARCKRC